MGRKKAGLLPRLLFGLLFVYFSALPWRTKPVEHFMSQNYSPQWEPELYTPSCSRGVFAIGEFGAGPWWIRRAWCIHRGSGRQAIYTPRWGAREARAPSWPILAVSQSLCVYTKPRRIHQGPALNSPIAKTPREQPGSSLVYRFLAPR